MTFSRWVRICDEGEAKWQNYLAQINSMDAEEIIKEFLSYLDYEEESDSGNVFHPITIGNCRSLMMEPLDAVLKRMREVAFYGTV